MKKEWVGAKGAKVSVRAYVQDVSPKPPSPPSLCGFVTFV